MKRESRKALFTDWPGNKWTCHSYSFPKPGEVAGVGPILRSGYKRRLHFPEVHTRYAFIVCMEGALHSSPRAVKQIARRDGVLAKGLHIESDIQTG